MLTVTPLDVRLHHTTLSLIIFSYQHALSRFLPYFYYEKESMSSKCFQGHQIFHYAGAGFLCHMAGFLYGRVCGCVSWIVFQFHHLFAVSAGMKATMWAAHNTDHRFRMNIHLIPRLIHKRRVQISFIKCYNFPI